MKLSNPFRRKPKEAVKSWVDTDQGYMNTSWNEGWWQQDLKPMSGGVNEVVEACVSALSQTLAMCPVHHLKEEDDGEQIRQRGSGPERALLKPNDYTSRSLFFNQIIRSMYFHGNGYAVATRDGNRAINGLYVTDPRSTNGVIDPETNEVYYWVSTDGSLKFNPENDLVYPARDVLNLRLHSKRGQPLVGETPITVAAHAIAANSSITKHQAKFFNQMARPSGILSTPQELKKEQLLQLREAYAKQTQGDNSGKVPILANGLTWQPMSLSSQDAQLVEAFGMTVQSITSVFRVPPQLVNAQNNTTYNNAETLMNWFLSSGLGFLLEHVELELNDLFGLPFGQHLNFNTKQLLRSDWQTQISTLGEGVIKGIYSPNEARGMLGLGPAIEGDEPRVQQQVVPLSAWDQETPQPPAMEEPEEDVMASLTGGKTKGLSTYACG